MTGAQRLGLLAVGAAIAVAAFLVLRPDEEQDGSPTTAGEERRRAVPGRDARPQDQPRSEPAPPLLLAGAVKTLEVRTGEHVRFPVRAREDDEVHAHGYDVKKKVPAGRTVAVRFPATLEGVFEIELDRSKTQIARLKVEP